MVIRSLKRHVKIVRSTIFNPNIHDEVHGLDNKIGDKHQPRCLLLAYRPVGVGLQGLIAKSPSIASGYNPLIEPGEIISRCGPQSQQLEA